MEEIKPCPFCGGEAKCFAGLSPNADLFPEVFYCECIVGPEEMNHRAHTFLFPTKEEAIAVWNKRV